MEPMNRVDPLMALVQITNYTQIGPGEVRCDMKCTATDPSHLIGILHGGETTAVGVGWRTGGRWAAAYLGG